MMWLFGATIGAAVHAFFAEFGMLVLAGACCVGGVVLLGLNVPLLNGIKRVLAYVLFGIAIGLMCWLGGYRQRATLDASADLRREIAAQAAALAEKDRQAKAAAAEALAQTMRRQEAESRSADMQAAIDEFEHQEPRVETKIVTVRGKTRVTDRCSSDDPAFARSVQQLGAARPAAKPPAAR